MVSVWSGLPVSRVLLSPRSPLKSLDGDGARKERPSRLWSLEGRSRRVHPRSPLLSDLESDTLVCCGR